MFVPRIDYVTVLCVVVCATFFAKGAQMDRKSPLLWGALSAATWIGFTSLVRGGIVAGLTSQALLFLALTGVALLRSRRLGNSRD